MLRLFKSNSLKVQLTVFNRSFVRVLVWIFYFLFLLNLKVAGIKQKFEFPSRPAILASNPIPVIPAYFSSNPVPSRLVRVPMNMSSLYVRKCFITK